VSDVRACSERDRVTFGLGMILIDQESQIVDFVKEGNPDVASRVVGCHFFRRVETSKFKGARDVFSLFNSGRT